MGKAQEDRSRIGQMAELVFYIGLTLELLIVLIDKSALINPIEGRLFQLTFLIFGLKVLLTRYSLREWISLAVLLGVGFLSYRAVDSNNVIRIVMFLAACKGIDIQKALKYIFWVTLGGVLFLIALSIVGALGSIAVTEDFGRGEIETRYCFGLGHPNTLHTMVFVLMVLGLVIYQQRLKWYGFLLLFLGNIGLFFLTTSRTGLLMGLGALLLFLLLHYCPALFEKRMVYIVGGLLVLACVILSLAVSTVGIEFVEGKYPLLHRIDAMLTGRIYYMSFITDITRFGLLSNAENSAYFDMGWIRVFYWYGFIPAFLYVAGNLAAIKEAFRKQDGAEMLLFVIFAVYTVMEAHLVSVYLARNYLLIFIAEGCRALLFRESQYEEYFFKGYRFFKRKTVYEE